MPDLNRGPLGLTPDELTTRLAPHMARFRLSEIFLDMDVAWEGEEARDFHLLLRSMAEWIDVHATSRILDLKTEIDVLEGKPPVDYYRASRLDQSAGFRRTLKDTLDLLKGGSEPGYVVRFVNPGSAALRTLVREIHERCVHNIPGAIAELEATKRALEEMQIGALNSGPH